MGFTPQDQKNFLKSQRALLGFCIKLTENKSDAEDLRQETIVKATIDAGKFRPNSNMRSWLFTIARNTYHSNKRKDRKVSSFDSSTDEFTIIVERATDPERSSEDKLDTTRNLRDCWREIEQLPKEQKDSLLLAANGESYDSIAEISGVDVSTAKERVKQAREILRNKLDI